MPEMLNIPKTIYVSDKGVRWTGLNVSEIIPAGETKSELSKLDKLIKTNGNAIEHNNTPLPGFTLIDRLDFGSTPWGIIDPRGYIVNITSDNLLEILSITGITEGLIQQKCVWARYDTRSSLFLLPISSADYKVAIHNTALLDAKVNVKDVCIGDTVSLQNGMVGEYMGVASLFGNINDDYKSNNFKISPKIKRQIIKVGTFKYFHAADAKILSIIKKATNKGSIIESVNTINAEIESGLSTFYSRYYNDAMPYPAPSDEILHISTSTSPVVKLIIEEIDINVANDIVERYRLLKDPVPIIVEKNNIKYLIMFPSLGPFFAQIDKFKTITITDIKEDRIIVYPLTNKSRFWYAMNGQATTPSFKLTDFSKFYKVVKQVKNVKYL